MRRLDPADVWDVDLLLGRDVPRDAEVTVDDLGRWVGPHVSGGVLGSLRAAQFDAASGNAEVADAAARLGLVPALTLETRDWLGARRALAAAPDGTVVRLAPQRQDCQPGHPGLAAIVDACAERGFLVLTEGDLRLFGPALAGRGLRAVFLDAHFYHLGDLIALAENEPGFRASTRLLNGPDSLEIVRDELGLDRLVFGSRAGWHEGLSALERLRTSTLSDAEVAAVASGTLRELLGRPAPAPAEPAPERARVEVAPAPSQPERAGAPRSPVVDAHAHWGPWFFSMETGSAALNTELLDRFGIDVQLVSAIEAITYDAPAGNAALDRVLAGHGDDRLRGLVTIDPRHLDAARADLERLTRSRWVGAKIHTHYSATPIASARMREAIALATEYDLPVLVHTWGGDVVDLADTAAEVAGARVIAGHMGAHDWRLVPLARERCDRVWFEPCWSAPEAHRVRWVLDAVGHDRLLFGSDATLIDPSVTLGAIEAADLTASEREAVMGANAVALFGLGNP